MKWNQENMTNAGHYRLTPDARSDLIQIRRYTLAQWGSEQSKKYLSELRQIINLISETPGIGTQRLKLGVEIFSFPHSSHVIYYHCHAKQLVVFAVLHKSMVPMAHLEDRNKT
jgi:toxin ParE1/3/4